mmetsp:Transcript_8684/g.15107  ORF Transcript_8684/g.15107 Transcript_8684/m.15107 type:complete len:196 (-) Transcript_8684:656-1243(-)|eukprot:CAMPEP_0183731256 /NCGR_PEP_ID=MMETSP0737-20130205/34879_1 /TAXON_ID=385413 /ORGANISM="Thalassiosira miniscula, Strain CCMP1093" /LENGTH=195 /DNA_ID=CAMNT_0025963947 /DNA_START=85 /DNA_END=672 /DNA_ORIENTATION=+
MEIKPKSSYRNGSAAFLILHMIAFISIAIGATDPSGENSEYFFACSGGELATVEYHLESDPSLVHKTTKDGEHCLHLSALSGNAEIVKLLLEKGADPDIRSTWEQGLRMHPLSWSTFYGRHEVIELLLEYGADVNADFDLGKKENGVAQKATVLDVVEQILIGTENDEEKERFIRTRNVLVKNGAKRYASLEPEL